MQDSIEVRSEVISGILEGKCGVGDGLFRVYDLVYTLESAVSDEALASLSVQKNLDALSFAVWDCAYMGAYLLYCKSGAHGHPGAEQLMKMGPGKALGVINEFAGKHGLTATPIILEQAAQYLDRIEDDLDTAEAVEDDVNSSPDMDDGEEWDEDTDDEDWDDEELITDGSDGWGDGWDTEDGDADTDVAAEAVIEAADEQPEEKQSNGYDHELHYRWFENLLSGLQGAWKDLYGNHVDGLETLNGFVVPGGVIGRSAGVLKNIRGAQEVVPNSTFGNILWEELVGAARSHGIKLDAHVSKEANSISAFQYNPSLQRLIASGDINAKAFSSGWKDYSDAIMNSMPQLKEELELQAVRLDDGGSLTDAYSVLSPFLISMAVVNEKRGLGGQLRICCGDLNTDRARAVANSFMNSVNRRERSGGSTISAGKFSLESPVVSENGVIVISFYYDKARYFSVPDFLGQLLVNLDESQFKPSPKNILLGRKLDNSMMTMNLEASGWCVPIVAGTRSGKGVLTLNILANVFACGMPTFYLDGKPDMAVLMWQIAQRCGIPQPMVVDCLQSEGITTVDHKPYKAPYSDTLKMWEHAEGANSILSRHQNVMAYLKMIAVVYITQVYNKNVAGMPYGEMFVVMDEVYKFSATLKDLGMAVKRALPNSRNKNPSDEEKEADAIRLWVDNLLSTFSSAGLGVFNNGIRVLSLSQLDTLGDYSNDGTEAIGSGVSEFMKTVGLTGAGTARLYGRKQKKESKGAYTWVISGASSSAEVESLEDLINNRRHFALSDGSQNIGKGDIFKPMLVLNENDSREYVMATTGKDPGTDGAFVGDMMNHVDKGYAPMFRSDVLSNPKVGATIGFNGVLAEMARSAGISPDSVDRMSLARGFELADAALRHFGIIGRAGINSVYDYICSTKAEHLWLVTDIEHGKLIGGDGDTCGAVEAGNSTGLGSGNLNININGSDIGGLGEGTTRGSEKQQAGQSNGQAMAGTWSQPSQARVPMGTTPSKTMVDGRFYGNLDGGVSVQEGPDTPVRHVDRADERTINDKADSVERSLFSDIPDGAEDILDIMAHLLVDDVKTGACDPEVARVVAERHNLKDLGYLTSYDFSGGTAQPIEVERVQKPVDIQQGIGSATECYGKRGAYCRIDSSASLNVSRLTSVNSIDCTKSSAGALKLGGLSILDTRFGATMYTKRLWRSIITNVLNSGLRRGAINRVSMLGNNLYVNGKLVILDGIIGGADNLRLRDIVDFKYTLKQLPMVEKLKIDMDMLRKAVIEFDYADDTIKKLFECSKRLAEIVVVRSGDSLRFDRAAVMNSLGGQDKDAVGEARVRNALEIVSVTKTRRSKRSFGISDQVWGSQLCRSSLNSAKEDAFGEKMRPLRAFRKVAVAGVLGAVGGAAWLVASGLGAIGRTIKSAFGR